MRKIAHEPANPGEMRTLLTAAVAALAVNRYWEIINAVKLPNLISKLSIN